MNQQPEKKERNWGGAREGAGRPKSSLMVSHIARPRMGAKRPVKIELKIRSGFPDLRDPVFMDAFEKATLRARRFGLRIIEFSVLPKKLILLCEIKNQEDLEKSFKSLNTTLAIFLKKWKLEKYGEKHEGPVFLGRFTIDVLNNEDAVKLCLKEIFLSASFHFKKDAYPDDYSSAPQFKQWKALLGSEWNKTFDEPFFSKEEIDRTQRITATPQFWLCQAGWRQSKL